MALRQGKGKYKVSLGTFTAFLKDGSKMNNQETAMLSPKWHMGPFLCAFCQKMHGLNCYEETLDGSRLEATLKYVLLNCQGCEHMSKMEELSRLRPDKWHEHLSPYLLPFRVVLSIVPEADSTPPCIYTCVHAYADTSRVCIYLYCLYMHALFGKLVKCAWAHE